jgi:hypothetical protein
MKTVITLSENLAHDCKWDAKLISDVYLEALTDANFHTLKKALEPIILKYFEDDNL